MSDEETTSAIIKLGNFNRNIDEIQQEIANMISCGTRYINLELSLGIGSCLVLGNVVAESMYDYLEN